MQLESGCYAVDLWKGDEHTGFYGEDIYLDLAAFHQSHYGRFSQLIRMPFDDALSCFQDGSIDLLHIDGLHTYDAVKHDFEAWRPKLSPRGIVLFHDTNVREHGFGVWRLWSELSAEYRTFEFLHGNGLGVVAVGAETDPTIKDLFYLSRETKKVVRDRFALIGERWESAWRVHEALDRVAAAQQIETKRAQLQTELDRVLAQMTRLQGEVLKAKTQSAQANQKATRLQGECMQARTDTAEAQAKLRDLQGLLEAQAEAQQSIVQSSQNEIKALQNEIKAFQLVRRERDAMLGSASWRMTAPLRTASAILPRRFRSGVRRSMKLIWWLITPWEIPRRLHYLRQQGAGLQIAPMDAALLAGSSLFDASWYLRTYPDVAAAAIHPTFHYLSAGAKEGRDPGPHFSTRTYLLHNPDVASTGINPLLHYIQFGVGENRRIFPSDEPAPPNLTESDTARELHDRSFDV